MTLEEAVAAFAAAWNTDDGTERKRLLTASCLPDAVFVAPQGQTIGIAALSASIGEFRRAYPPAVVSFGASDGHGGFVNPDSPSGALRVEARGTPLRPPREKISRPRRPRTR